MTLQELQDNNLILFKAIRGSKAFGTFIEGVSDIDHVMIHIAPLNQVLLGKVEPIIKDEKGDDISYEIGRFIELATKSNPSIVEALFTPEDCILYKNPILDELFSMRDIILSKKIKNSFLKYAEEQLKKASGLQKFINLEKDAVTRKTLLDFTYTIFNGGSRLYINKLKDLGLKQEYVGLVAINNMRYTYAVYYDILQHLQKEKIEYNSFEAISLFLRYDGDCDLINIDSYNEMIKGDKNLKYKGIVKYPDKSNDISLSSVPKTEKPIGYITINFDGYSSHCKKYKEYTDWLKNRNTNRYVDNVTHGQTMDSKNIMHLSRLIDVSMEVAKGEGFIIRRPNRDYLLSIRRGEVDLKELTDKYTQMIPEIDELFNNSNLPEDVDANLLEELLMKIRKDFYDIRG